jgi:hypothetical protein
MITRTRTSEAVRFDGTEESWSAIRALDWDDCWPSGWPEHVIYSHGYPSAVMPGDWVTVREDGLLVVVDDDGKEVWR